MNSTGILPGKILIPVSYFSARHSAWGRRKHQNLAFVTSSLKNGQIIKNWLKICPYNWQEGSPCEQTKTSSWNYSENSPHIDSILYECEPRPHRAYFQSSVLAAEIKYFRKYLGKKNITYKDGRKSVVYQEKKQTK